MKIKKQNETIVSDPVISGLDADIRTGSEDREKDQGEEKYNKKERTKEEIETAKKMAKESLDAQKIFNAENRTFIDKEDQY